MVRKGTKYTHPGFAEVDLEDFLESLPAEMGKAARAAWLDGDTEEEIARSLGVRQQRVSELIASARQRYLDAEGR